MDLSTDLQTVTSQAQAWWSGHAASASPELQAAMAKTHGFMNPFERAANQAEALYAHRAEAPEGGVETMTRLAYMCYHNMFSDLFVDQRGLRIAGAGLRALGEGDQDPSLDPAPRMEYTDTSPEPTPGPDA